MDQLAAHLRTHAWVDDARCSSSGSLLAMSQEGIEALWRLGRQPLIETLQTFANTAGYVDALHTPRLFHSIPASISTQQMNALLQSPLPRDAQLLHEHQHAGIWTLELLVPLDLAYFPGHFPQAPVLPGVVQIAWALSLAASRLGTPARCTVMEALKFQQLLRPGDRTNLTLRHDIERRTLHFAYRYGDKAHSSGRLAWKVGA